MKLSLYVSALILLVPSAGCVAATPGARPQDMSAARHEAMANDQKQEAAEHSAQYDANATAPAARCYALRDDGSPCWASDNPTSEHLEDAERHRKMAADHRAASRALREAEARACAGITDRDRDMSPFARREDIAGVEALTESVTSGKNQFTKSVGAKVTFRAVPGMTAPWLQRLVDCHVARSASLGHDVPEMAYCPLMPKGVSANVEATRGGFAVLLRSDDAATAREILRRAQGLAR